MIQLNNIEKKYNKLEVLKGITFTIEQSSITAIVGPNGSGKSTIIKSILGLVKPDKGDILINNRSILGEFLYRKNIGYMPQIASFPENLTTDEVITMIADLRNEKLDLESHLVDELNLIPEMNKKIRTLSGGNKQKLSAFIALIFNPQIIILDEPTAGLDPIASSNLKQKILDERAAGKTIILTSHIMSEIEELANNIIFLMDGKILFDGKVRDIVKQSGESKLENAIANMMRAVN